MRDWLPAEVQETDVLRAGSNLPDESSDTVATTTTLTSPVGFMSDKASSPGLVVEAYCTFNGWIVRIEYPTQELGWIYRPDLGGHSLHRWEWGNVLVLLVTRLVMARGNADKRGWRRW